MIWHRHSICPHKDSCIGSQPRVQYHCPRTNDKVHQSNQLFNNTYFRLENQKNKLMSTYFRFLLFHTMLAMVVVPTPPEELKVKINFRISSHFPRYKDTVNKGNNICLLCNFMFIILKCLVWKCTWQKNQVSVFAMTRSTWN